MKLKRIVANVLSLFVVLAILVSVSCLMSRSANRDNEEEFDDPTDSGIITAPTEDTIGTILTIPTEVPEPTESIKPPAITEPTVTTEPTEVADTIYLGNFKLTAYCSCGKCCGSWAADRPLDDNGNEIVYTASGAVAQAGRTIAVDPGVIPYGTQVSINGRAYVAEDCGGAINGNRIDVYFNTHDEALEFGVQYADVYIVWSE